MEKLKNIHPCEILKEEFLEPFGITPYRLAKEINIPVSGIMQILKKKRRITTDTALRLAAFFGNSADFWVGIQSEYDIREEREKLANEIGKIHNIKELAYISRSTKVFVYQQIGFFRKIGFPEKFIPENIWKLTSTVSQIFVYIN